MLTVTDIWYPGRSRIHEQYRAVDLSARDIITGEMIDVKLCREAEREINRAWIYDDARPNFTVCWYHVVAGGALHFHLQVHPATAQATTAREV